MTSLLNSLSARIGAAFEAAGLPAQLGTVTVSDRPDLCQFQCNGAMAAAKIAKKAPRQIAETITEALKGEVMLGEVSIAGPGFINLNLTDAYLNTHVNKLGADERSGVAPVSSKKIVLDFGGPNVAKPMHVGHLRSSIIGDSLQRLFRFLGHDVVSDVHLGDWGKPMGLLITQVQREQPDLPYFDESFAGPYPATSPVTMEDLERLYPKAAAEAKADGAIDDAARLATAQLQEGRTGYRALWQHFIDVSRKGMEREFGALGVVFDLWKGEADADRFISAMVEALRAKNIVEKDQGAEIIRVARKDDNHEIPPLILVKTDGAATYATTDLATIVGRVEDEKPDLILYVVDQRQHGHFEQVFRAAELGGVNKSAALEHIGFGTMNGTDGKPFKTRAGGVMKLHDLIQSMRAKASERLDEAGLAEKYGEDEKEKIADLVGMAALKFADLSNHRLSDYVFDLDRFMRFEGKTGPYLQYAAVRMKSILRRAEEAGSLDKAAPITIRSAAERELVLQLVRFVDAVMGAQDKRAPNLICEHAYNLAQSFSKFYADAHILSEKDDAVRGSRLALCRATLVQLVLALSLLGIDVPERM